MTLAVLFDFNGVLVDDEDVHFEAFRRVLEVLGVTISHEVYRRYLGFDDRGTVGQARVEIDVVTGQQAQLRLPGLRGTLENLLEKNLVNRAHHYCLS